MSSRRRSRREDVFCVVVLGIVATVALWPVVVGGALPLDTGRALELPPWRDMDSPPPPSSDDHYAIDEALVYYPNYVFLSTAAQSRESLLWSPLEFEGAPFLGRWDTRCLSPFSLPVYVMPLHLALRVSAWLKVFVAGLLAFWAGRRLGFECSLALFVGLSYQLSGAVLLWLSHPSSDVVPWLPIFFLATVRIAEGSYRHWPVGAVACGLMLLGGDGAAVVAAAGASGFYLVLRVARVATIRGVGVALATFLGMCGVGVVLGAAQLLPFAEYWLASTRPEVGLVSLPRWLDGAHLLVPQTEAASGVSGLLPREWLLFHVGSAQLALVLLYLSLRRHVAAAPRSHVDSLFATAFFLLLAGVGGPALSQHFFGTALITYHQALAWFPLGLGLAGGATIAAWLELDAEQSGATLRRFGIYTSLMMVVGGGVLTAGILAGTVWSVTSDRDVAVTWLFFLAVLALIGITFVFPRRRAAGYGAAFLVGAAGLWSGLPHRAYTAEEDVFPETEMIEALVGVGASIEGGTAVGDWPLAAHGIRQRGGTGARGLEMGASELLPVPADERSLVGNLILDGETLTSVYRWHRPRLTLTRAFASGHALFSSGDDGRVGIESDGGEVGSVSIESETNGTVVLTTMNDGAGRVTLRDTFFPGWRATVDGKAVDIAPSDDGYRVVEVSAGEHRVEFVYEPEWFRRGLMISLGGVLVVVGGFLHLWWANGRDGPG